MFLPNIMYNKTHILCSVYSFLHRAVYQITWKNIVQPGRPQMTIWRMRIACWIPTAINTHSQYVYNTYHFSTTSMVVRTRLNVTFTYIAVCEYCTGKRYLLLLSEPNGTLITAMCGQSVVFRKLQYVAHKVTIMLSTAHDFLSLRGVGRKIGRASCRERV